MSDPFQLARRLQEKHELHLYRRRRVLESPQSVNILSNGQSLLNFCSNDYLGLANHPSVLAAMKQAVERWGAGSGASHLVIGHSRIHHELEAVLADWVGQPKALLFSTGYMANIGVIAALVERGDTVIQDKLNHASLLDGAQLSRGQLQRYSHNDLEHLEQRLKNATGRCLVVTDSVFSMDGDVAALPEMSALCRHYDAWLMVDDAHGLGVLGDGHGALREMSLTVDDVPVYMGTLGKALGSFGAFVAGSETLIEFLIQSARSYIYTTAMPPAVAAATLAAIKVIQNEAWRVQHLKHLIRVFQCRAQSLGLPVMPSSTAIQPLLVKDSALVMAMSEQLQARGFLVGAIRPPTVPVNAARLRITLCAEHSEQDVMRLLDNLSDIFKNLAVDQEHL